MKVGHFIFGLEKQAVMLVKIRDSGDCGTTSVHESCSLLLVGFSGVLGIQEHFFGNTTATLLAGGTVCDTGLKSQLLLK